MTQIDEKTALLDEQFIADINAKGKSMSTFAERLKEL